MKKKTTNSEVSRVMSDLAKKRWKHASREYRKAVGKKLRDARERKNLDI